MKKYLFLLLSAMILVACGNKKPVETSIAKNNVDLTGNAFNSFRLGGEVRLLMAPHPEDASKWMIRATVPLQKADNITLEELSADINLLDENGTKVRDGFSLTAEDLASVVPVFNAARDTEKTIVFSAAEGMKKDFSYKEAATLIENVKKIGLTINNTKPVNNRIKSTEQTEVVTDTSEDTEKTTTEEKKPLTLNSLLKDYGIYGMLAQYEKYWKKGDRRKAKEVEDRLYEIEKKVSKDSSIPQYLRDKFVQYIENKEDEIERRY